MRSFMVLAAMFAVSLAADEDATIVSQSSDVRGDGSYRYAYELSNGVAVSEEGHGGVSAQSSFRYTTPDGSPISLTYTADENGFQPTGDNLPVPPSVPELIARALEYIRTHSPPSEQYNYPSSFVPENLSLLK